MEISDPKDIQKVSEALRKAEQSLSKTIDKIDRILELLKETRR